MVHLSPNDSIVFSALQVAMGIVQKCNVGCSSKGLRGMPDGLPSHTRLIVVMGEAETDVRSWVVVFVRRYCILS